VNRSLLRRHPVAWIALAALTFAGVARAEEIWRLDNLNTIASHAVTVVGAPQLVDEQGAKVLRFDGAHDGVFMPVIPIAGAKAFTIEVLFSPAAAGPEAQRFFHLQDTTGSRALMEIRTNGHDWWLDTFMQTGERAGNGLPLIDPTKTHPTDHWYWVALRYDGTTMSDYVNGRKELEGAHAFAPYGEGKVSIGVRQNLVYWFKGAIREVRFHPEALPPEKLQRLN
jgi:hypothetical protein